MENKDEDIKFTVNSKQQTHSRIKDRIKANGINKAKTIEKIFGLTKNLIIINIEKSIELHEKNLREDNIFLA